MRVLAVHIVHARSFMRIAPAVRVLPARSVVFVVLLFVLKFPGGLVVAEVVAGLVCLICDTQSLVSKKCC
jgi:hypothetical protein